MDFEFQPKHIGKIDLFFSADKNQIFHNQTVTLPRLIIFNVRGSMFSTPFFLEI